MTSSMLAGSGKTTACRRSKECIRKPGRPIKDVPADALPMDPNPLGVRGLLNAVGDGGELCVVNGTIRTPLE